MNTNFDELELVRVTKHHNLRGLKIFVSSIRYRPSVSLNAHPEGASFIVCKKLTINCSY